MIRLFQTRVDSQDLGSLILTWFGRYLISFSDSCVKEQVVALKKLNCKRTEQLTRERESFCRFVSRAAGLVLLSVESNVFLQ